MGHSSEEPSTDTGLERSQEEEGPSEDDSTDTLLEEPEEEETLSEEDSTSGGKPPPKKPKRKARRVRSGPSPKRKKVTVSKKDDAMDEDCDIETSGHFYSLSDARPASPPFPPSIKPSPDQMVKSSFSADLDALRLTPGPNGRSIDKAIDVDAMFVSERHFLSSSSD
jgi:hypothetical protein